MVQRYNVVDGEFIADPEGEVILYTDFDAFMLGINGMTHGLEAYMARLSVMVEGR